MIKFLPSLKVSILTILLVITLLIVGVLSWYNFKKNSEAAVLMADRLLAEVNEKVLHEIRLLLDPIEVLCATVPDMPGALAKPTGQDHPLDEYFKLVLPNYPYLYSIYIGYEDGDFHQVASFGNDDRVRQALKAPPDASWAIRHISGGRRGPRLEQWRFLDARGKLLSSRQSPATYDPTLRPWYKQAKSTDRIIKTRLYVYYSLNAMGTTIARRLQGRIDAVFAVDIVLDSLSHFIREQDVGEHGQVFIFSADGQITAYSEPDKVVRRIPIRDGRTRIRAARVGDLDNPVVDAVYEKYMEGGDLGSNAISFEVGGKSYLARISPIPSRFGSREYVAVVAAAEDFIGPLATIRNQSLLFGGLLVLVLVPLTIFISGSISRSLHALAREADDIAKFNLDSPVRVESYIREVNNLSQAIGVMKTTLGTFGKYVPRDLVRRWMQSGETPTLGGGKRELTILFSDIAGFTTMSEDMDPEELMLKISEYFKVLSQVIIEHEGTIDKFIGDAIMAFWNAPEQFDDHVQQACLAALRCSKRAEELNRKWEEEGRRPMFTRFGLHTGETVVGNVGSADRMNYTAIGTNVNLASRLEGLNKAYGTRILVSEDVFQKAGGGFLCRSVDLVVPVGKTKPTLVYELLGALPGSDFPDVRASDADVEYCDRWEQAYSLYRGREWEQAAAMFETLSRERAEDTLAVIYRERCIRLARENPGPGWTGVEEARTK